MKCSNKHYLSSDVTENVVEAKCVNGVWTPENVIKDRCIHKDQATTLGIFEMISITHHNKLSEGDVFDLRVK